MKMSHIAAILLLLMASAQCQQTAEYWLNKGDELHEKAINETQNQTSKDLLILETLKAYENAIEIEPNSATAWFKKGEILADFLGRFNEALNCSNKSTEIDPLFADAWYQKGKGLTVLGNYIEGLNAYNESLRIIVLNVTFLN